MKGKSLHFWKADLEQAEMRKNQSAPEATIDINERGKVVVTFKRDGASNRGIVRCLYLLAKNIQNFLAEFKLPLTELNLRRFIAYREAIVYKLKAHHLPEGSIEHLLACDDLLNEDYDVSVTKTANLIELTVMSLTTGDSRTFRMLPNQVSTYIQNREVLDEIEKCRPNSDA